MNKRTFTISGKIVDVIAGEVFGGTLHVSDGKIADITRSNTVPDVYIMPGFTDAHIHIESSMLVPSEFARLACIHGTVATVSDPHEIANVMGVEGVRFMVENGRQSRFKFSFGAPSCVPATTFETAGAEITTTDIRNLFSEGIVNHLAEMMNYPGVLNADKQVIAKIEVAKEFGFPVDGHAPGLTGGQATAYAGAGISTDHECFTIEEALDKIKAGMHILIREGSAAKNFETLIPLLGSHPQKVMFCSDDLHPDDLVKGHINLLIKRALLAGYNLVDVLRACTLNPALHYKTHTGLLQKGDAADFVVVDNLQSFNILKTYIDGILVAENGQCLLPVVKTGHPNNFFINTISEDLLKIKTELKTARIIGVSEGQLITKLITARIKIIDGFVVPDPERDIAMLVVLNRYRQALPAIGFVQGFGMKTGALASSIAHDSHNIVAVGCSIAEIVKAIGLIQDARGGIAVVNGNEEMVMPLPVAGLMTGEDGFTSARIYENIQKKTEGTGTVLIAPFMTLAFLSLLVIPDIKLSDRGLFDGNLFEFISVFQ